jgi:hypothetical protein
MHFEKKIKKKKKTTSNQMEKTLSCSKSIKVGVQPQGKFNRQAGSKQGVKKRDR